jgi:hypothetical protein
MLSSAVTPQRAIINIASAGSVLQMNQQVQNSCDTLLMMLARFGAAGGSDQQSA